jgi:endonuclease YncB( thermonuclease family)
VASNQCRSPIAPARTTGRDRQIFKEHFFASRGSLATTRLQALTAARQIVCQENDRDRYGRIVAICRASGEDLGAMLVREGVAWAFT